MKIQGIFSDYICLMPTQLFLLPFLVLMASAQDTWILQHPLPRELVELNSVFFTDAKSGFVCGDQGTILRTEDGGENWIATYSGTSRNLRSIHFPSESVGYAIGDSGTILKTSDAGITWSPLNSGTKNNLLSAQFQNEKNGYAAGDSTLLKTIDGGHIWSSLNVSSKEHYFRSLCFSSTDTGFVGSAEGWIHRTLDGGASWSRDSVERGFSIISLQFPTPDTGYALSPWGIFKSMDSGVSWKKLDRFTSKGFFSCHFVNARNGYVVGDNQIIYKTTDGGDTWTLQFEQLEGRRLRAVYFPTPDTGYTVSQYGVFRTGDGGATWSGQAGRMTRDLYAVQFPGKMTGYAVGDSGKVLRTRDAGLTWLPVPTPTSLSLKAVHFLNGDTGCIVGWIQSRGGIILRTTNGGLTWEPRITRAYVYSVSLLDPRNGFILSSDSLLRTSDGGITWTSLPIEGLPSVSMHFTSPQVGYRVGAEGRVYKTENGGDNWARLQVATSKHLYSVHFGDENTGFAVGDAGTIARTLDAGRTWNVSYVASSTVVNRLSSIHCLDASTCYASGFSFIMKTVDKGQNWTTDLSQNSFQIESVCSPDRTAAYAVGRNGVILKTSRSASMPLTTHSRVRSHLVLGADGILRFQLPESQRIRARLLDGRGRHVATLIDGFREAGKHQVPLKGIGSDSQIYFVDFLDNGGKSTVQTKLKL